MASKQRAGRVARRLTRRAYRALRRARIGKRIAKAGANNVGKATFKKVKRSRGMRRRRRRY